VKVQLNDKWGGEHSQSQTANESISFIAVGDILRLFGEFSTLTPLQQKVIKLRAFEKKSYGEIASELKFKTRSSVQTIQRQAVKKMPFFRQVKFNGLSLTRRQVAQLMEEQREDAKQASMYETRPKCSQDFFEHEEE